MLATLGRFVTSPIARILAIAGASILVVLAVISAMTPVAYEATIDSGLSQEDAFAYMADFANAREWDPAVLSADQVTDGGPQLGAAYELVSAFLWAQVPLRYETTVFDTPRTVVLAAENTTFTVVDTITVQPIEGGSRVTYQARLQFQGLGRVLKPVIALVFGRTAEHAAEGLRVQLN